MSPIQLDAAIAAARINLDHAKELLDSALRPGSKPLTKGETRALRLFVDAALGSAARAGDHLAAIHPEINLEA